MTALIRKGHYHISESSSHIHLLDLQKYPVFKWEEDTLAVPHTAYNDLTNIGEGEYRIYSVRDITSGDCKIKLELQNNDGKWESYFLPKGLPSEDQPQTGIVSTNDITSLTNQYVEIGNFI